MKQLSLIEKTFFLKKISLFQDLDLDLLIAIAEKMHQDHYDAKEMIFEESQRATRMYFIIQGFVEIISKEGKLLRTLSEENFFGEEALLGEKPRLYTAICKTDALFLTVSHAHLLTILSECPSVAISLLQCYTQTLPSRFHSYDDSK